MLRVKIYQYTELEQTNPPPQFFDMDEEQYADQVYVLPLPPPQKGCSCF